MKRASRHRSSISILIVLCGIGVNSVSGQPNIRYAKQGYSMRLCFNNCGVLGSMAYGFNPPPDSIPIGLEYPIGSPYEHIYGAGIWVGAILDTSAGPVPAYVRAVTTSYEGWAGPLQEFFPGSSPADTIWKVVGRGVPRPASWDPYWGNSIPSFSFSDNDHYCMYDDYHVNVIAHVPLRLKVVQSGYVWSNPYAEAIHIMEYKIINTGVKQIDSAYVGMFLEGYVGTYRIPILPLYNYAGYYPDNHIAYINNPVDIGSTPVGISLVHASRSPDSLRYSFRWWSGASHPNTDAAKYEYLRSGRIDSNQVITNRSDTRFLISFGPFTLYPPGNPLHDTVVVAFGIVSGQNLTAMSLHAVRARSIYENGGQASLGQPGGKVPARFELYQNYPNPFNPVTTIRFALPRPGLAKITVFDILGAEVATLVAGELPAGIHSVRWDASNRSAGVYFYQLRMGEYVATKKLMLLR